MSRLLKESTAFFKAKSEELEPMRRFLLSAIWELGLPAKEQSALWLAAEEAATNVIRHAYLYGEGTIRMTVRFSKEFVELSFFDEGRRLDIKEGERLNLSRLVETGRKGGLGLYLIEKIMDEVGYLRRGEENEFRMRKYLKAPAFPSVGRFSLRTKVSILGTVVLLGLLVGTYWVAGRKITENAVSNFDQNLQNLGGTLAASAADPLFNRDDLNLFALATKTKETHPELSFLVITDQQGKIWAEPFGRLDSLSSYQPPDRISSVAGRPQRVDVSEFASQTKLADAGSAGEAFYYMMQKVYSGNRFLGTVHLAVPAAILEKEILRGKNFLLKACFTILVIGLIGIWVVGAYLSRPFEKLSEGLRRVKEGEPSVPVYSSDEFGQIARAVNEITAGFKKSQKELLEQEKMKHELELAQEVQQALLPAEFPQIEGMEVAAWYQAAREIGGDFYDFFAVGPDLLGIAVADVSGKGVPGALGMAMVRTALRLEAKGQTTPAEILCRVNRLAVEGIHKNMFVTIFLALFDTKLRKLSFSSTGHMPMVFYRAKTKKAELFNPAGLPMGLVLPDGSTFEEKIEKQELGLEKGDFFVLFTDGIVEAADSENRRFGVNRLVELIETSAELSASGLVDRIKSEVARFTGDGNWADDMTVVVIKDKITLTAQEASMASENGEKGLDSRPFLAENKKEDLEYSLEGPDEL